MNKFGFCRSCEKMQAKVLIDFGPQPIVHHLLRYKEQKFQQSPFILEGCENCGFLQLQQVIDPKILYENYFTLSSWKYQPHMNHLVETIIEKTQLPTNSKVLEIGCNDGTFLEVLQKSGFTNLLGIEPTTDSSSTALKKGFAVIQDFVNSKSAHTLVASKGQFKIVILRQVLEHIGNLTEFRSVLKILLKKDGFLVIEVPDTWLNLIEPDYALWEEHVNYFTIESLEKYLNSCGIRVIHNETMLFSGRCLTVIGQFVDSGAINNLQNIKPLLSAIENFKNNWNTFSGRIRKQLGDLRNTGHKIAVYGAGARSCTFVNFNHLGQFIEYFVDDQAQKQGFWVPGCCLQIESSEKLYENGISVCLLGVNTENEKHVMSRHNNWDRNGNYFRSILPPSEILLEAWNNFLSL